MPEPAIPLPDNRRRHERAPAIVKVMYPSAGVLRTDYSENISRGGLFIATDEPLAVGELVQIHLVCAGAAPIPARGIVRWAGEHREPGEAPVRGVGVQFALDDPDERERLERAIDALLAPLSMPQRAVDEGPSLLIVDPNRHARVLFREGLETLAAETWEVADYLRVSEAADGEEALDELARHRFSMVMVELRTPGIDGVDLIRRIRTRDPEVPIFATSRLFPGARQEAIAAGADVFLPKPLKLKPLFNTLRMLLRGAERQ
jgi:uncharacterized protein (TIGR02266 family)